MGRRSFLKNALKAKGLTPEDIDITIMSRAHWDHSQNYDPFQHTPMLVNEPERKYAQKPHRHDYAAPVWSDAIIEFQPKIEKVEGHVIEPGVTLINTPGHSPRGSYP